MRWARRGCFGWLALLLLGPGFEPIFAADSFNYDRFGAVSTYRGHGRLHQVVLLVSGDDGWDAAGAALAQRLASKGALVAGIDYRGYRERLEAAPEACVSPASDLENLSHYLQSKAAIPEYLEPLLAGYGSGATLVYATLAAAPEGLFKGALSVGFSAQLNLKKALCDDPAMATHVRRAADGTPQGVTVTPATRLPGKWIVVGTEDDPSAMESNAAARDFVSAVPGAEWLPQVDAAFARLTATHAGGKAVRLPPALADLPLIAVETATANPGQWFGVFLTGDGGWAGLDKGVSAALARNGIPMVGWDSLKYFWKRRTPEGAAHDLDRVLQYYALEWRKSHVLLVGYSQGADTLPFMINRLPAATHALVGFTALLGISDNALWEFHLATWLGNPYKGIPTAPELERWSGTPYLCIYGESDADAACEQETGHGGTAIKMPGGHHFGGDYDKIATEIMSHFPLVDVPPNLTAPAASSPPASGVTTGGSR